MIKLEDLKIGDKIYVVCENGLGLYAESIVKKELFMLDNHPNPWEAVCCKGGLEIITRSYEKYLFRTQEEAEKEMNEIKIKSAKELLRSNKFIDRLFECATSSKRLNKYEEHPIYELAIELYKENLNKGE